jgi:hypothetical protein
LRRITTVTIDLYEYSVYELSGRRTRERVGG